MSSIVVIWDIMLDKFSYGLVKRLNPEWPNPLLNIYHEEYKLWGAANVAANVASLNGSVDLIGILWDDPHGKIFQSLCHEHAIHFTPIFADVPTITKQRFMDTTYQQQLLRVDYEEKCIISYKHNEQILVLIDQIGPKYIIFSDYNKWLITPKLIDDVKIYAQTHNAKIFVDAKPNNLKYFEDVYLIKPNFKEFCQMVDNENLPNTDEAIKQYGLPLVQQYRCNLVITRWHKGAVLITQEGQFYSLPTEAKQVFDVTGAWDTFLAAIVYSLSKWNDLKSAVEFGNKASWIVVGKLGTATVTPEELWL